MSHRRSFALVIALSASAAGCAIERALSPDPAERLSARSASGTSTPVDCRLSGPLPDSIAVPRRPRDIVVIQQVPDCAP